MMKVRGRLWPASLKNRLFVSIVLLVLVPSFLLQMYNVGRMEKMMKGNVLEEEPFLRLASAEEFYFWEVHPTGDMLGSVFANPVVYSHYSILETTDGQVLAYLRISLDVNAWLSAMTHSFQVKQSYYVIDGAGQPVALTAGRLDNTEQISRMLDIFKQRLHEYFTDPGDLYLYNGIFLPNTGWYLISRFPLEVLSGERIQPDGPCRHIRLDWRQSRKPRQRRLFR